MLVRIIFAALSVGPSVSAAIAQQDPVTARENLMKENNKRAIAVVRMMRGPAPFDAAEVDAAFTQWAETAQKLPGLLPDNSKTGGDNRASPKIWVDKKDFDAKAAAFAKVVSDNHDKAKSSLEGLQLRFTDGPSPDGQGSIPNITQYKLKDWSEAEIAETLESGITADADRTGGNMVDVVRNTSQMTAADRMAIATYIMSLPAVGASRLRRGRNNSRQSMAEESTLARAAISRPR